MRGLAAAAFAALFRAGSGRSALTPSLPAEQRLSGLDEGGGTWNGAGAGDRFRVFAVNTAGQKWTSVVSATVK